jgi:hypothetical protein
MIEWIKWASTFVLIVGTAINAAGFYPAGPIILIVGGVGWLIVAWLWRDAALIVNNAFICAAGVLGLVWNYL